MHRGETALVVQRDSSLIAAVAHAGFLIARMASEVEDGTYCATGDRASPVARTKSDMARSYPGQVPVAGFAIVSTYFAT